MAHSLKFEVNGLERQAWSNWKQSQLGNSRKSLILLFHGFPDNNETWLPAIELLDKEFPNSLIIAPQLLGYESSTTGRPDSYYHLDIVAEDYILWTQFANGAPVHLVGHDWGACAAYRAHSSNPSAFASVATLAIPHSAVCGLLSNILRVPKQLWYSSYMLTMNLPFVYRPRITQNAPIPYIRDLWTYWSPGYEPTKDEFNSVCKTLHQPGAVDSTTAYYRNLVKVAKRSGWQVDWKNLLVIGGTQDGCMSVGLFEIDKERHPDNVVILEGVGHFMQRENPGLVVEHLTAHIKSFSI